MTVEKWLGADNYLGIDIWNRKYRYGDESFEEWLDRVSGGDEAVKQLVKEKKFLFGGRILANRGLNEKGIHCCYSNCFVMTPPEDNLESIFDTAKNMARTYSYGGGVGLDISKLAPKGAKVHNTAKESSGAVSFMDLYSLVTGLIGQSGRRGALMISMSCEHPDIEDFIQIKSDLNRVTKANISVRMTDKFMQAVKEDRNFTLHFERPETGEEIIKIVRAKDLFMFIAKMNWDMGEPGVLFWDRIESWNLLSNNKNFEYAGVNPCAEETLPAGGSCCLGSINLSAFVINDGHFDYQAFNKCVATATRALNDILDEGLPYLPLQEQQNSVKDWRQIGLGIMGLADALIHMGIKYGSEQAIDFCNRVGERMIRIAATESSRLGELSEYGCYPCSNQNEVNTDFATKNFLSQSECGSLYNSQLLTIAPTGTLSTMLGVSGGLEPIFANYYNRRTESLYNETKTYKVYTPIVKEYMDAHGLTDDSQLPDYFVTAQDLDYHDRIKMQAAWQRHIDASISSTVNVPNDFTVEQVADLYMYAWEQGLKGITIFRDGCERAGILTTSDQPKHSKEPEESAPSTPITSDTLPRGYIEDVPENITYKKFKLYTGCGKLYLFVGIDELNNRICDFFTNTDAVGGCTVNTQAVSRLMSASLRGGVDVSYVVEQLQKAGTCPAYQYARGAGKPVSKGKSCASAIANVLKDINEALQNDDELAACNEQEQVGEQDNMQDAQMLLECPSCHSREMAFEGGCVICKACGYSKCD